MREREEVQEMPRQLVLLLVAASGLVHAALLPEQIGAAKRGAIRPLPLRDAVTAELGLDGAEEAEFVSADPKPAKFTVTVWRLKDPTSALSFFLASREQGAVPSKLEKLSVTEPSPNSLFFARGNYAVRFKGLIPPKADIDSLFGVLPRLDQSGLPTLPQYLPEGRLPNSDRYIVGPATLERFEGRISPGIAAFSMSAEGVSAQYPGGISLTIFNYPTPQMARERAEEFRKVPGSAVKRTGPLVVTVLGAADANAAELRLAKVNYQATLTWNEANPDSEVKRGANFLLGAFTLAGFVIVMSVGAGVAFGLIRVARRKTSKGEEEEPMIRLHLGSK
jgi:hypothetical protein